MAVQSPYLLPGMNPAAVVQNPVNTQVPDTAIAPLAVGRQGDLLMSQVHGQSYSGAMRGNYFICPIAGTTGTTIVAFGGTTSGGVFGNPVGSGVVMDVRRIRIMPATATLVASVNVGLEFGAVPVSTTYQSAYTLPLNVQAATAANKCKVWSGVTIVAMTYLRTLDLAAISTTWATAGIATGYETTFDGNLLISPGFAVNIATATSQSTNKFFIDVEWQEWAP